MFVHSDPHLTPLSAGKVDRFDARGAGENVHPQSETIQHLFKNMNDPLTCAIIGHLVGDYLLQNDWMALNKKKHWFPCIVHCVMWTICVCLFAGWPLQGCVPAILFAAHFIQDHTNIIMFWMTKVNSQEKFAGPPCAPWSIIVVDNVWHIVTIWAVWKFLA